MTGSTAPLPWGPGGAARADRIIIAGLVLNGVYSLALLPLVPSLITAHPALLEALRGSIASMINMGALARTGHTSLLLALTAALPSLVAFDWVYWWAGRRWGGRGMAFLLGHSPRAARRAGRVERAMDRFGGVAVVLAYVLPIPAALIYLAAGWSGMRLRVFLPLDVLGALLWIVINVMLGYALGQSAVDVATAVSHYALVVTIVLIVGIVGWQVWRARGV